MWQEPQCLSRCDPVSGSLNKGSPCFQIRKGFGGIGKTLEEMGRERMTRGPTCISDTLRVHVWKFGFEKVKQQNLSTDL